VQVRLSELIDEINKANLDHWKVLAEAKEEGRPLGEINRQYNSRRDMLANEAVSLMDSGAAAPTPQQCMSIAIAAWRIPEEHVAVAMWKRGLDLSVAGQAVRAPLWRGFASYHFQVGNLEEGRRLYQQAQDEEPGEGLASLWRKGETFLHWATTEASVRGAEARADYERHLDSAEKCFEAIQDRARRREGRDRLREARAVVEAQLRSTDDDHAGPSEAAKRAGHLEGE